MNIHAYVYEKINIASHPLTCAHRADFRGARGTGKKEPRLSKVYIFSSNLLPRVTAYIAGGARGGNHIARARARRVPEMWFSDLLARKTCDGFLKSRRGQKLACGPRARRNRRRPFSSTAARARARNSRERGNCHRDPACFLYFRDARFLYTPAGIKLFRESPPAACTLFTVVLRSIRGATNSPRRKF